MGTLVKAGAKRGQQGMSLASAAARWQGVQPERRITGAARWRGPGLRAPTATARPSSARWQHGGAQCRRNPGGWANNIWTAAPTPSGHANVNLNNGNANDKPDANNNNVSAVL
jgi:hypothetical protein